MFGSGTNGSVLVFCLVGVIWRNEMVTFCSFHIFYVRKDEIILQEKKNYQPRKHIDKH